MAGVNYEVNIQLNTKAVDKQLNALEKRVNTLKRTLSTSGRTEEQSTKSTAAAAEKLANLRQMSTRAQILNRNLGDKIAQLEAKGLDLSQARYNLNKAAEAQGKNQLIIAQTRNKLARDFYNDALRTLKVQEKQTAEQKRQATDAAKAANKKRSQRLQGVALGAGFPLLFGGGPGAILGGAAGGLVGGPAGFAAQIALSAIGQQFDKLGTAAIDLGKALDPLSFDLETVAGATGIAGTKTEEFLAKIEEFRGKAAAAAEASKLMASRVGKDATDALTKFGKEAQTVGNQISIIFTKVLAAIAAAAGPLLASLGAGLTRINQLGGFRERAGLTGADLAAQKFLTRTGRLSNKQREGFAAALGLDKSATAGQIRKAAEARALSSQQTFENQQAAALEIKAGQLEAAAEAAKAKTTKGRRSRIPELQAQEQKLKSLLELERTMFELKRNDDALGVRRLEHQIRLAEFAEEEAKIRASDVPQKEKDLAINNIGVEIKREELQLAYDIEQINKAAVARSFEAMQNKIKQQNELNVGLKQQLQLSEQIADILGGGMARAFDLLITGAANWGAALRDIAANVLQDIARQLIRIYVIEQAVGFMRDILSPKPFASLVAPGGRYEGGALPATPPPLPSLPGKALGGAVSSGKPYMVGERGPEMFVPGAKGNIIPNNAMGGANVVVNVDASGSNVEGDGKQAKALGSAIALAVQSELVKQKKPGGLLY